jgi:hypothetical protein
VPEPSRKTVALASSSRYIGTYEIQGFGNGMKLRVYQEGEQLRTQADGQPAATLLYQGHDTFVLDVDPSIEVVFATDGDHAAGLTVHQSGMAIEAKRVE